MTATPPSDPPFVTTDDASKGLTSTEARRRLAGFGPNTVAEATPSAWQSFLSKFWAPVPWLLEAAIVLQVAMGAYLEAAVVGGLLLFNTTLGALQEGKARAALAALRARLAPIALVRRDGEWVRLPAAELVPDDIVRLSLGALVPADTRILSGSVMLDQSALTGESVPVEAEAGSQAYAGAMVRRGQAVATVTATGAKTYFGRAAELVRLARAPSTEQRAVFGVTRNLAMVNATVGAGIVAYALVIGLPSAEVIRLALTALLATIPVALPATFALSAALGAQELARRGVLLTRLSAAHEAAGMDVLCADKTGTLTRNTLSVDEVRAMPGFERERVLALAALASAEADQDPIDATIRRAAAGADAGLGRLLRFVPFDPATRLAEALARDSAGREIRIVKGAFEVVAPLTASAAAATEMVDAMAARGQRVIAVAVGPDDAMALAGLIAVSDPPREDSAELVGALRQMGVRTLMVTGDSPVTAAAIARKVGIPDTVCTPEQLATAKDDESCGVFARVMPEAKYRLVEALQRGGHVVGMCGDGVNDAPALRQAHIGIAVLSATDAAKAAAGMVMTEPGLGGIVFAVREGRTAFQRLLTYAFNMLVKKVEIVLFLGVGLVLTGHAILTPALMVLLLVTNDFLTMSLTTDRASTSPTPSRWRMRNITLAAVGLGVCKLGFSTAVLAVGKYALGLTPISLRTLAFVGLVFGNQALLFALRERRRLWHSRPGGWVLASSAADIAIASILALSGILMAPLPWKLLAVLLVASAAAALLLDQIKLWLAVAFRIA
jgi:H+-transporting ATPase